MDLRRLIIDLRLLMIDLTSVEGGGVSSAAAAEEGSVISSMKPPSQCGQETLTVVAPCSDSDQTLTNRMQL